MMKEIRDLNFKDMPNAYFIGFKTACASQQISMKRAFLLFMKEAASSGGSNLSALEKKHGEALTADIQELKKPEKGQLSYPTMRDSEEIE